MRLEFGHQLLPYCLRKIEDNVGGWISLNRDYKPFNHATKDGWAEYEKVPANARIKKLNFKQMQFLSYKEITNKDTKTIYLYSDYCYPPLSKEAWQQYSEKLQRLAKYMTIER
jgi:hypothetical protein